MDREEDGLQSQKSAGKICRYDVGYKYCSLFDRFGVPQDDCWRSLLSCLRSVHKYSNYREEQKQQIADLLIQTLEGHDFSEERYRDVARKYQTILASTYAKRLEEALQETVDLAADFKRSVYEHQGAVENLQEKSVAAIRSGEDPDVIVHMLKATFADVISVMKKDAERLEQISKTDALTGLLNRRAFNERLEQGVALWETQNVPLCLLLLDIDNLKNFNDRFGHRIGDQALQTFSQIMRTAAHATSPEEQVDCCRLGGDEFAILLYGEAATHVADIAQAIRTRLETYDFVIRDNEGRIVTRNVQMTVSCGYSKVTDSCEDAVGEHLVDTADTALYQAKGTGRNCIVKYVPQQTGCLLTKLDENDVA